MNDNDIMNRVQILQEMGITSWVSKQGRSDVSNTVTQDVSSGAELGVELSKEHIDLKPAAKSEMSVKEVTSSKDDGFVHEVDLAKALEMRWTLVFDGSPEVSPIFSKIIRAIEDLGAKCQIFDLSTGAMSSTDIQADIVLAFGQKAGVFLSGERDVIENLREIVFEVQNKGGEDIPLVVTYHPRELLKQPNLKSLVWDDILWARSIWLESRL